MKITKIHIERFRGFTNQEFEVGSLLTAIAGQNGTQKSTLLGIISQPFSLSSKHPMHGEKPLCGGTYRSAFSDKFRLSPIYDKPGEHEWTLYFDNDSDYNVKSLKRTEKENSSIRFSKGKMKGEGYIGLPVIFLSLKRLIPVAEESSIQTKNDVLTADEVDEFKKLHNKILITHTPITSATNIVSTYKNSLGVNTDLYDWNQNSMGQDNLAKIVLALFSFKRLKEKYPNDYQGGILAIDEIDATMYPASQIELIKVLRKYASELDLQIIFTTHSLTLLKFIDDLQQDASRVEATKKQIKMIYLKKMDNNVLIHSAIGYDDIYLDLNVIANGDGTRRKITTYVEDQETRDMLKAVVGKRYNDLDVIVAKLSCDNLVELASHKIPAFNCPFSLVIVDGDVRTDTKKMRKVKSAQNILVLPGSKSPEREVADYLYHLSDSDALWNKLPRGYNNQVCFREYTYDDVMSDRIKAKEWFRAQIDGKWWGIGGKKVLNAYLVSISDDVKEFEKILIEKLKSYL